MATVDKPEAILMCCTQEECDALTGERCVECDTPDIHVWRRMDLSALYPERDGPTWGVEYWCPVCVAHRHHAIL